MKRAVKAGLVALCLLVAGRAEASELFITPTLELSGGYDDNRFADPLAEASPFIGSEAGLDFNLLLPADQEVSFGAGYVRNDFTETDFGNTQEAFGRLGWRWNDRRWSASADLRAGLFQDSVLPDDDLLWFGPTANLSRWNQDNSWALTLGADVRRLQYDSRLTWTDALETGNKLRLRPGWRWLVNDAVTVWIEAYGELLSSNEDTATYQGGGSRAGVSWFVTPLCLLGGWGDAGSFRYPDSALESGLSTRQDNPVEAGVDISYRVQPWCELFAEVSWLATHSNEPDQDYSAARASAGMRLVFENTARP